MDVIGKASEDIKMEGEVISKITYKFKALLTEGQLTELLVFLGLFRSL